MTTTALEDGRVKTLGGVRPRFSSGAMEPPDILSTRVHGTDMLPCCHAATAPATWSKPASGDIFFPFFPGVWLLDLKNR